MLRKLTIAFISLFFFAHVQAQEKQKKTYPVVIKFISEGAGVPSGKPVADFIKIFKKKNHIQKIKIDTISPMGREEEYYLALPLNELTKKQKTTFIRDLKKVNKSTGDAGQIQFEENVPVGVYKGRTRGEQRIQQ